MPELPEVETVRQTLRNFIRGKQIKAIEIPYERVIDGDANEFASRLQGQKINDIDRVGKYLIFILDNDAFVSHLRMEGKYNIVEDAKSRGKHEHVIFKFTDGSELRYHDTRKFGRMELVDKCDYKNELPLSKLGAEPWDADVTEVYNRIHRSTLPIKTLLLDQHIMTGIGNIYANEICFRMNIDPKTPGNKLSKERTAEMIKISSEILSEAIKQGGTTIHSFDANGVNGLFQTKLQVHMQKECATCHGEISKEKVNGRGTYYCKRCQKKHS
jgi:formamidopyrimidine-DNA glycosylase (fpg)